MTTAAATHGFELLVVFVIVSAAMEYAYQRLTGEVHDANSRRVQGGRPVAYSLPISLLCFVAQLVVVYVLVLRDVLGAGAGGALVPPLGGVLLRAGLAGLVVHGGLSGLGNCAIFEDYRCTVAAMDAVYGVVAVVAVVALCYRLHVWLLRQSRY